MKILKAHEWLQQNQKKYPNASYLPDVMEAYAKYYHSIKQVKKKPNDN